jgi:hypothetical protein
VDAAALRDHLVAELADAVEPDVSHGLLTVTVAPGDYRRVAELARRDPELACNFFDFLCGVDEEARGIGVVLHVYSTSHHHQARQKHGRTPAETLREGCANAFMQLGGTRGADHRGDRGGAPRRYHPHRGR